MSYPPKTQETSEQVTDKVQVAKESAKKITGSVANKANALYNKLSIALGTVICVIVFLTSSTCFSSEDVKSSKIIIPKFPYVYSPEYVDYEVKLIKAGLMPAEDAFFAATKAVGKPQNLKMLVGLDAREVFSVEYVRQILEM